MISRERICGSAPPCLERWPACHPFQTIPMIWTASREVIFWMTFDGDMSDFWMSPAMNRLSTYHDSAADACTYCKIDERLTGGTFRSGIFSQRRAIDICVESNRDMQGAAKRTQQISIHPSGLWRCHDIAVGGRSYIQVNGSER